MLEAHGALVGAVDSPAEALAAIERLQPHVLLVDVEAVTFEAAAALARDVRALRSSSPRLPAIAMCSVASAEDRIRALVAGYQMCLPKPADSRELIAAVAALNHRDPLPVQDSTQV